MAYSIHSILNKQGKLFKKSIAYKVTNPVAMN